MIRLTLALSAVASIVGCSGCTSDPEVQRQTEEAWAASVGKATEAASTGDWVGGLAALATGGVAVGTLVVRHKLKKNKEAKANGSPGA